MNNNDNKGFAFHTGYELPSKAQVAMTFANLRLHACGVFSNVYRGTLVLPKPEQEVAIKKTWPKKVEKNFELLFLSGIGRQPHKNIVQMLYAFSRSAPSSDDKEGKDGKNNKISICESYVFAFLPDTLHNVLRAGKLDGIDMKLYTWQLFEGLRYLQAHSIVHRDVKPVNLLLDHEKGILKIGDFGNAKIVRREVESTSYQVTRFYRAPELLLESTDYYWFVDIWSAGCCVGEMMTGKVLFPGETPRKMLKLIVQAFGVPTERDHLYMKTKKTIDPNTNGVKTLGLKAIMGNVPNEYTDFLSEILKYRPRERLHGRKLLYHDFFDGILDGKCRRANGVLVTEIIKKSDFDMAIQDDSTAGKQYAASVLHGDVKFSFDDQTKKDKGKVEGVKESVSPPPVKSKIEAL